VGGGKIHTPRPRSYAQKMPRKMRRAALRSALSAKMADQGIVLVDRLAFEVPKTKEMAATLKNLVGEVATALVVIPANQADYDKVTRSTNNLANAKPLHANYLNIRDLLGYDKVVIPVAAIEAIQAYLG
jgi:large subunit ribosomal protein L4